MTNHPNRSKLAQAEAQSARRGSLLKALVEMVEYSRRPDVDKSFSDTALDQIISAVRFEIS